MGRRKKPGFKEPKMFSSRVEASDYYKFEEILRNEYGKNIQEIVNLFLVEMISGSIKLHNNKFICEKKENE